MEDSLGYNAIRIGGKVRSSGFNTSPRISNVTTPNNASSFTSPKIYIFCKHTQGLDQPRNPIGWYRMKRALA